MKLFTASLASGHLGFVIPAISQSVLLFRNLRVLTGSSSVHLNDTLGITVHFPTIEGSDSYSHLHTRHLEEEIYFRNIFGKILKQAKDRFVPGNDQSIAMIL